MPYMLANNNSKGEMLMQRLNAPWITGRTLMKKLLITAGLILCASALHAAEKKQTIVGYIEKVNIPAVNLTMKAKLDTGATTTSINANIIDIPEKDTFNNKAKDEAMFVTFAIVNDDKETKHLKKEIVRFVNIKKKKGGLVTRPVIEMTFCIAGQLVKEEVNLSEREQFNYDVLVGRNMLSKARLLIDSSNQFTARPNCAQPETAAE